MADGLDNSGASALFHDNYAHNAFDANCPTREVLSIISGRWVCLTIVALQNGSCRYGELAVRIGGITHKMLTQTLRVLEENGLVDRCVTPSIPVTVDYSLTPLGKGLLPVVHAIKQWAEANVNEVKAARQHYARPLGGGAETAQLVAARRNSGTAS